MSNSIEALSSKPEVAAIGSTVHMYFLSVLDGSGVFSEYNQYTHKSEAVILNNGKKAILDDENYSSVSLVDGYGIQIEKPSLHIRVADASFGNSLDFMLYTEKELSSDELKFMVEEEVKKKFKAWTSFDLSSVNKLIDTKGEK